MYPYVFFIVTILLSAVQADPETSSSVCEEISRKDIESHLSTKTPYRVVANLNDKPQEYEGNAKMLNQCYLLNLK